MADLNDLILQNLKTIHDTQLASHEEMNRQFDKLNGRLGKVEDQVDEHASTLSKVKGAFAALTSLGTLIAFFHEKFDGILKAVGLSK